MSNSSRSIFRFLLSALVVVSCSSSGDDDSGATEGSSAGGPTAREELVASIAFDGAVHPTYPDITRVAALPEGGIAVATLDYEASGRLLLARLDRSLEVVWASRVASGNAPADVLVHDDAIVVAVSQSPTSVRLLRFELDGSLRDAHDLEGVTAATRLVGLTDGGLLLLASASVARLDSELRVAWSKTIAANAAILFEGDYIFAGTPLRLAPANATGIEVVRTSPNGDVRWQSFATPGPGRHTLAGLGVVAGELVVACGNDSADTRSTANLKPVFVSRFDPSTGEHRASSAAAFSAKTDEGEDITLAFGSGLGAAVHEGAFHIGAVINAGGPTGARTSTVARLDGDQWVGRTIGGAFTIATDGDLVGANLFDVGPVLTRIDRLDGEGACLPDSIVGTLAPIETIEIRDAGGLDPVLVQDGVLVNDLVSEHPTATRTVRCGP